MKNYLVKSLFKIVDTTWSPEINRANEVNVYDNYLKMHEMSVISHEVCLQGDWELVFFSGETTNIHEALKETFFKVYDLWKSEPCNILYTDPDVLMVSEVDFFGQFEEFRMFNVTDPKSFNQPNIYNRGYPNFLNAGVRYFPASMKQEIWDIGLAMANRWDLSDWDTEQIILNEMAWSQGLSTTQMIIPELAYQAFMIPDHAHYADAWNGCKFEDAKVIHWHSSRNAKNRLEIMQTVANQVGIFR